MEKGVQVSMSEVMATFEVVDFVKLSDLSKVMKAPFQ